MIGDKAVSDANRLALLFENAAGLALIFDRTNAGSDRGQCVIRPHFGGGTHVITGDDQVHDRAHVDVDGAFSMQPGPPHWMQRGDS